MLPLTCLALAQADSGGLGRHTPAPIEWANGYSFGKMGAHPHAGVETSDGGLLMVGDGQEEDNASVKRHLLVLKVNSSGQLDWQLKLGECDYNYGKFGLELADKTFLVAGALCGERQAGGAGTALRRALLRIGWDGEVLYTQPFENAHEAEERRDFFMGLAHSEQPNTIVATGAVGGQNASVGYLDEPMFLIAGGSAFVTKLTYGDPRAPLEVVWDRLITPADESFVAAQGMRIAFDANHGHYALGVAMTEVASPGNFQFGAAAISPAGELSWSKIFVAHRAGHAGHESHPYAMSVASDGSGIVLGGLNVVYDDARIERCQGRLLKLSADGTLLYDRRFQALQQDTNIECYGIDEVSDGGHVVTCGIGVKGDLHPDDSTRLKTWMVLLHRTDAHGNTLWQANYTNNNAPYYNNAGEFVVAMRSGGYAVFVDSQTYGDRTTDGNFGLFMLGQDEASKQAAVRSAAAHALSTLGGLQMAPGYTAGSMTFSDNPVEANPPVEWISLGSPVVSSAEAAVAAQTGRLPPTSRARGAAQRRWRGWRASLSLAAAEEPRE